MENTTTETTFYQDAGITVTQSRYVANSKTYAMRNISSVHIYEIVKSRRLPVGLIILGALLLFSDQARLFGLLLIAIGVIFLFLIKNEFAVRISTNAGEINSLTSKDRSRIENIVNALNEAIIHRG